MNFFDIDAQALEIGGDDSADLVVRSAMIWEDLFLQRS